MASERQRRARRRRRTKLGRIRALLRTPLGPTPTEEIPAEPIRKNQRERCPVCGRSERVLKSGVMARHAGLDKSTDCAGIGIRP